MIKTTHRFALLATIISTGLFSTAFAFTEISSQLDLNETNSDVTHLQEFLAAAPSLYPQALVTGYFGNLTRTAVIRFQAQYGIAQVGRVGPQTRDKINELIRSGWAGGSVSTSASNPAIAMQYMPQVTATGATFNWMTTNGPTTGRVHYSNYPLQMNEGDINSLGFAITSGQIAPYDTIARSSQTSMISGLQPNTTYYYTIVATDARGNVSVVGPNNTFRTNAQ